MIFLNKKVAIGLTLMFVTAASANAYSTRAYSTEGQDFAIITIYENSHGTSLSGYGKSTVWEASLNEVISYNKRKKRPEIVDIRVQTYGYDDRWNYAARINCAEPAKSYIKEHGNPKNKTSFKKAMQLDYGNPFFIERKAVEGIFSNYC